VGGDIERVGVARGELLAVDVPPGPTWLDIVAWCWREGVAFLPLHHRLTDPEKRAIVDLARPAAILTAEGGSTWFADPGPVDERIGIVLATSGTAGSPRLVELSRDAITAAMAGSNGVIGAGEGGRDRATGPSAPWVCCLSPAHVGGLLVLLRGVLGGAPVLVQDHFDVDRFATGTPDGARASLVPAMLRRLVDARVDLSRFGELLVGGDAVEPDLAEAARGLGGIVVSTYGLTETCGGVVYDGRPFPGTQLRVQDPDALIEIRGPTVMEHYRGDPAATGAAFSVDGWLRTGDVGSLDEGVLRIEGRNEDLIRTGAEKVWPEEVERVLRNDPRVAEVAVAARPDPKWGERVVAFVVPHSIDDPPTLSDLRETAAGRIARFKAPRELVLVEALPRTVSGKIRRISLRDLR
jgi:o-succinylbenzoate---CoA ligase